MDYKRFALLLAAALALGARARALEAPCSDSSMSNDGIGYTSSLGLVSSVTSQIIEGRYALPDSAAPTQLVVMFHGHGNDSCSWRNHLRDAAARGAVAVAIDYVDRRPGVENYGWFMRRGGPVSLQGGGPLLVAPLPTPPGFSVRLSHGRHT